MKSSVLHAALLLAAFGLGQGAWAQSAPGTDPIVLGAKVGYLALPTAPVQPSAGLDASTELPSWLQAKVSRYEAMGFAKLDGGDGTIYTNNDVVSRQTGNALQRTCTTDVASNTITPGPAGPSGRYGPGQQSQIAVLRGDVVTICK